MSSSPHSESDSISAGIVIIDDHALVREALIMTVELQDGLEILGEAADGENGLELLANAQPDLALVDFSLPDMTGAELISAARAAGDNCRFLMLTGSPLSDAERAQLAQLADGFHHKENGRTALLDAIRRTLGTKISPRRAHEDTEHALLKTDQLTTRERGILREIARGQSVDFIATELGITAATVRKHRENIMLKLGLTSSTQLVRTAMQIGQY